MSAKSDFSFRSIQEVQKPIVSWVVPVYNAELTLAASLRSILDQTYRRFEVIVINDGSTDRSLEIANDLSAVDGRIRVLSQENQGVVAACNRGLREALGDWIARLDSDDIAKPDRLAVQVAAAFSSLGKTVLIGSDIELIDSSGHRIGLRRYPYSHAEIMNVLGVRNPIAHPSVLFKRDAALLAGGYNSDFEGAEDYHLWIRMSQLGELQNIPIPLTCYRIHDRQIKATRTLHQLRQTTRARLAAVDPQKRDLRFHLRTIAERLLAVLPGTAVSWLFKRLV